MAPPSKSTSRQKPTATAKRKQPVRGKRPRATKSTDIQVQPVPATMAERVTIDEAGRLVVPAKMRKALGIDGGQALSIRLEGKELRLHTVETAIERAQAKARERRTSDSNTVVDDFIAERRAEADKE